jgi:NAD(P)-dependent dehydrogenase (short-subunit alcohol dehydrogenase family)
MKTKVAIVTGGGSGLGLAITQKLLKENIKTIVIGRNEAALQSLVEEHGSLCAYRVYDLQDTSGIDQLIEEIYTTEGSIDILINNAGINLKKPFLEVTAADFLNIVQTNLLAVFAISKAVSKYMVEAGTGSILHISSMAAQYGIPKVIAYTAAKSAVEGMTRAMAVELSPLGIRVNCIAPGFIQTAMSAKALDNDPERKQKVLSRTPMGHLGLPEDVADAAFFLTSDAAKYITGVILPVDGGNSIGF